MNETTIAKYIREQESHDIAMDKLTEKEYDDDFKCSKDYKQKNCEQYEKISFYTNFTKIFDLKIKIF